MKDKIRIGNKNLLNNNCFQDVFTSRVVAARKQNRMRKTASPHIGI